MAIKTKIMAIAVSAMYVLASCNLGMNESLSRTTRNPFGEVPRARSFREDKAIVLNWTPDEAADEYYLYCAADDSITPHYVLIYNGPHREYRDTFSLSQEGEKYLYRLGKRRGEKYFVDLASPGKAALGVVSTHHIDIFEPNDDAKQAVQLRDKLLSANSYYFSSNSNDNIYFYDEDWYYVEVPPRWTAQIRVVDLLLTLGGGGDPAIRRFKMIPLNGYEQDVVSDSAFTLSNDANQVRKLYFRLVPNWAAIQLGSIDVSTGSYGEFLPYTIELEALLQ
jgi:hypothetical protein